MRLYSRVALGVDLVLTLGAYQIATTLPSVLALKSSPETAAPAPSSLLFNLEQANFHNGIFFLVFSIWGAVLLLSPACYQLRGKSRWRINLDVARAVAKGAGVLLVSLFVLKFPVQSRFMMLSFFVLDWVFLVLFRFILLQGLGALRRRGFNQQNLVIVGTDKPARELVEQILKQPDWGYRLIGFVHTGQSIPLWRYHDIPVIGTISDLGLLIQNIHIDWVIFATTQEQLPLIQPALAICEEMGTNICLLNDFFPLRHVRRKVAEFFGHPVLLFSRAPQLDFRLFLKYSLDRMLALLGLILTAPMMLAISAVIKLSSPGPVFFRQQRCGLNGKRFTLYKFRTMVPEAELLKKDLLRRNEMDGPVFKITNDPRVTKVGRFLRKMSLDELPQLFNVLKGDMSLVGPRPPLPVEVTQYDRWQRRRLSMKPGITCLWQVNGRNNINFEKWMRLDLEYIDNWSLWLDTRILLQTIPAVLSARGAR